MESPFDDVRRTLVRRPERLLAIRYAKAGQFQRRTQKAVALMPHEWVVKSIRKYLMAVKYCCYLGFASSITPGYNEATGVICLQKRKIHSNKDGIMRGLLASRAKITVFFFAMVALATIMGTVAYLLESGQPGSKFENIPVSIYWAIVTVTTLGYGDLAPLTVAGKFVAAFCVLIGYCIMAVPTGIVIGETVNAAMTRQDETTGACPSCGVHGHLIDAKFCRRCGERLNNRETPHSAADTEDAGAI